MRKTRDGIELRGKTPDERLNHAEVILSRMRRRLHTKIIGVIPPMMISGFVQTPGPEGALYKSLILVKGKLIRVGLSIDSYATKNTVKFKAEIKNKLGKSVVKFETRRLAHLEQVEVAVEPGDLLSLYVMDERTDEQKEKDPNIISGIWIGCLLRVTMDDSEIKSRMIEELENDEGISDNLDRENGEGDQEIS